MHMRRFCTEVTILPLVELWKKGVEKEDLKFVEIFWGGFTIRCLSNLPATVAGN